VATLTIKNLPDELYARLKARAAEHRRSINSEAILAVEQALALSLRDPAAVLAQLRRARGRLDKVHLTDRELRAARRSGRA
jgi:plasmid stability protein